MTPQAADGSRAKGHRAGGVPGSELGAGSCEDVPVPCTSCKTVPRGCERRGVGAFLPLSKACVNILVTGLLLKGYS